MKTNKLKSRKVNNFVLSHEKPKESDDDKKDDKKDDDIREPVVG